MKNPIYTHFKRKIFRFSYSIHTHTYKHFEMIFNRARTQKSGMKEMNVRVDRKRYNNSKNNNNSNNNNNVDSATTLGLENLCSLFLSHVLRSLFVTTQRCGQWALSMYTLSHTYNSFLFPIHSNPPFHSLLLSFDHTHSHSQKIYTFWEESKPLRDEWERERESKVHKKGMIAAIAHSCYIVKIYVHPNLVHAYICVTTTHMWNARVDVLVRLFVLHKINAKEGEIRWWQTKCICAQHFMRKWEMVDKKGNIYSHDAEN